MEKCFGKVESIDRSYVGGEKSGIDLNVAIQCAHAFGLNLIKKKAVPSQTLRKTRCTVYQQGWEW